MKAANVEVVELQHAEPSNRNRYRVPQSQWRKWSIAARLVFNVIYSTVYDNQQLITHPRTPKIKAFEWKTIAWNSAWLAADAVDGKE